MNKFTNWFLRQNPSPPKLYQDQKFAFMVMSAGTGVAGWITGYWLLTIISVVLILVMAVALFRAHA